MKKEVVRQYEDFLSSGHQGKMFEPGKSDQERLTNSANSPVQSGEGSCLLSPQLALLFITTLTNGLYKLDRE